MILSILMLLSVIPLHSSTIYADDTKKTVMNGTGNIQNTDSIWFGIRGKDLTDAGSEIQWRVLDTNTNIGEDGLFLLSEKLIGKAPYHNRTWDPSRKWQGSDAQKWCKDFSGENGEEKFKSLTGQELAAIKPTTESNPGDIAPLWRPHPEMYVLNGDKVFFLSFGEADKYLTDDERIAYDGNNPEKWWLRSPHRTVIRRVWIVKENGGISTADVTSKLATRPAFNLDKEKVLFTSPAVDGKQSNGVGKDALKVVEKTNTTEWKLTLIDRNRTFQLDTDNGEKVTIAGNILTIPYKDATTGTNEYISAVVEKNGSITYYGRLKAVENSNTDKNGEVTVQLPADFDKTTDTLYLINEQLNGDKKTDYSSEKVEVKIPTKHKITVIDGTTDKITAAEGEQVKVTATIPGGKAFDKWTAVGIDLTDEQKKQNPLTFDMPENNVTFTANFKKKSSGGSSHDTEYYNITTKTDKHGTVEARSKAREGTEVSVTVSPDKGYKLDEITVTDRRGRDIKIKETNRENRYKFTMPARDVTVEATFKQIKQEQPSKPTTPPTIPPTNNNKPIENNIIKKQQTTVFTIGSNIMTVITDGKATQTTIDAKPFLSQGRVMIPVRYAAESLGMQVEWNKQTQTVVLKDRENTVMIPIKTNKIIVGNQEYTSDVTPILKNGRTYLTISNIAKALRMRAGQDVKWDNKIKQVTIIKEVEVR